MAEGGVSILQEKTNEADILRLLAPHNLAEIDQTAVKNFTLDLCTFLGEGQIGFGFNSDRLYVLVGILTFPKPIDVLRMCRMFEKSCETIRFGNDGRIEFIIARKVRGQ